ncbi:MAG: TIGR00730 family Rossman fold protein [Thermodesulfovibrio sp.]|nr:TIGR00730 family Rossman fold protein [Thermodesulfovibrio sp.]
MELHFTRNNGSIDEEIDRLIALTGTVCDSEIVREMIIAALKAGQEDHNRADLKLMNTTLKEMRFTAKIFGPYRQVRKVTVFGSARTRSDEPVYGMARQFGEMLAQAGYMVITGAGGGIMQAVNEGAGPEHSFGVNIKLPFEQSANYVLKGNPRLITYKYFFNRKVAFLKEADAIALFPGGFGTLDEAMETLTLLQTGKRAPLPLLLVDEPGGQYWNHWLRFFEEELLGQGYIESSDFGLFERVDSISAAVRSIDLFYRRYHSLRYVDKQLVIRLQSAIGAGDILELNEQFRDILIPGGRICGSCSLPEESAEKEIAGLPRLVVDFNRRDFGRLRKLIDVINGFTKAEG